MTTTRRSSIGELAARYGRDRDAGSLHELREAVRRSPNFRPDLDVPAATAPLLAREAYDDVVGLVDDLMPGAFFSPAAHAVLAGAHEAAGRPDRARKERRIAQLAMAAILGSGDGSADRPWAVLRVSDEYDVLRSQDRVSRRQTLVTRDGRDLDHHVCDDGTEAWFDITPLSRPTA